MTDVAIMPGLSTQSRRIARLLLGAAAWGAMMAISALVAFLFELQRGPDARMLEVLAIYFAGGFIAFAVAVPLLKPANRHFRQPLRLAFAALVLAGLTVAATAAVFSLDYRSYYAEWHANAFSVTWFYQQFFTALSSTYQYLVIGSRLYWPLGPLFLLATSWWLTRKAS